MKRRRLGDGVVWGWARGQKQRISIKETNTYMHQRVFNEMNTFVHSFFCSVSDQLFHRFVY